MKKISLLALLLSFVVIGFTSCSKSNNSGPSVQTLNVGPENLDQTMDVTFKADQSGNGNISTLTFTIGGKDSTVNNPSMPWSYTANGLSANNTVSMSAKGTVSNGEIKIKMEGYGTTESFADSTKVKMN